MHKHNHGFTVVELLSVIAIITILATIVFGGITVARQNAVNGQIRDGVDAWKKAIDAYAVANAGNYPTISNGQAAICLSTGLPANSDFSANACSSDGAYVIDSTFNAAVNPSKNISITSDFPTWQMQFGRLVNKYRGIMYAQSNGTFIAYSLIGTNQSCGKGTALTSSSISPPGQSPVAGSNFTYCELRLQ